MFQQARSSGGTRRAGPMAPRFPAREARGCGVADLGGQESAPIVTISQRLLS
jgi:hypothetical protein